MATIREGMDALEHNQLKPSLIMNKLHDKLFIKLKDKANIEWIFIRRAIRGKMYLMAKTEFMPRYVEMYSQFV